MKVKELIEKLQEFNGNLDVWLWVDGQPWPLEQVLIDADGDPALSDGGHVTV